MKKILLGALILLAVLVGCNVQNTKDDGNDNGEKGDETESGKALLVGDSCPYCSDPEWEMMSSNLP